jgi:hypothetical protein
MSASSSRSSQSSLDWILGGEKRERRDLSLEHASLVNGGEREGQARALREEALEGPPSQQPTPQPRRGALISPFSTKLNLLTIHLQEGLQALF